MKTGDARGLGLRHHPHLIFVKTILANTALQCRAHIGELGAQSLALDSGFGKDLADPGLLFLGQAEVPGHATYHVAPVPVTPAGSTLGIARLIAGAGIGLAIAHHAVELNGRRIEARSAEQEGLLVRIELPTN